MFQLAGQQCVDSYKLEVYDIQHQILLTELFPKIEFCLDLPVQCTIGC